MNNDSYDDINTNKKTNDSDDDDTYINMRNNDSDDYEVDNIIKETKTHMMLYILISRQLIQMRI